MSNTLQEMTQDMQARIRELAYLMWESAGRQQGMAMEYWLKAEGEVLSTMQAAANRMMPAASAKRKAETKQAAQIAVEAKPAAVTAATATDPAPVEAAGALMTSAASAEKPAARKPASRAKSKA